MRIVIIGAVAAGTSVAAKARRNSEDAEIVIYEKDSDISYSVCGLPYYIGTDIERAKLTPRDPAWFKKRYNIDIKNRYEVVDVDIKKKTVTVHDIAGDRVFSDSYDRLVFCTGARPVIPGIPGTDLEFVFTLRNVRDADRIKDFISKKKVSTALVAGSGFIGLEMAEALAGTGIEVSVIEKASSILPAMDGDMSVYIEEYLRGRGIMTFKDDYITSIEKTGLCRTASGKEHRADLIIISAGARPETSLAVKSRIETASNGAIITDEYMETSVKGVYAAGDCAMTRSLITGEYLYRPLGSTANKTGRICGDAMTGGPLSFRGILGTGIVRIFDRTAAMTGLTERDAREAGFVPEVIHNIKPDRSEYMPGSSQMVIKAVADRKTGRILGAQIFGADGVDKRIDVFATAITFKAKAEDLFHLDLAYAPPYSTTKDPVMYTGMILDNAINRGRSLITPAELRRRVGAGDLIQIIDVRSPADYARGHIPGAVNIPLSEIRDRLDEISREHPVVTHCNKGVSGNAAQNILILKGYSEVYNLSGGYKNYAAGIGLS